MGTKVSSLKCHVEMQAGNANQRYLSEEWRYTGPFSRRNRLRGAFPGLGIATVAFAIYCGYEYLFLNDDHGHGAENH